MIPMVLLPWYAVGGDWVMTADQFYTTIQYAGLIFTGVGWTTHWIWEKFIRDRANRFMENKFGHGRDKELGPENKR